MKIENPDSLFGKKTKNFDSIKKDISELIKFDTDGYDEYNQEGFKKMIKEKNIKIDNVLDLCLEKLSSDSKEKDFSIEEIEFHSAMRAYLHCDHKNAISFIKDKFNFNLKNKDNLDFSKKYKFLNFVAVLIFDNLSVKNEDKESSLIIKEELSVFKELKGVLNKKENSFLFNYLGSDYINVIENKKNSVMEEMDYKPFEISPKVFALDKMSSFVMVSKHNLKKDFLYISKEEDYEKIHSVISKKSEGSFLKQEDFNKIIKYFSPLVLPKKEFIEIDAQIYRKLKQPYHRKNINKLTGINIERLSINEQFYFLNYLKFVDQVTLNKVKDFNTKFDLAGFKTFLSIEQGGSEMGDKILQLGEGLPEDVAKEIFKKYGEIIDIVDNVTEGLKQKLNFNENDINSEDTVKNNLLLRAKNLLEKYADNPNKNPKDIPKELEKIKTENVLTLSIFQSLRETKGIKFEDMKDFSFSYDGKFTEEEEKEGENIINKNYKDAPQGAQEAILSSFKNAAEEKDDDIIFPNLKHKNKIVSFMQLNFAKYKNSEDYGKKVYFGSFNVDPDFANGEIGSAMIERTIDNVARTHTIEADCNAEQSIGAKYIESGFVAIDFYDFKGLPGFQIIRNDKEKDKLIGKNLSKEEIISILDGNKKKGDFDIISASEQKDLLPEFKKLLDSTKIISRYFYDKNNKRWIVVVEPNLFSKQKE